VIRRIFVTALFISCTRELQSQELRGVVLDSASRRPLAGAVLVVTDSAGTTLTRTISNERGLYRVGLSPSAQRLQARRIGFRVRDLRLPMRAGELTELNVVMVAIPALLEPMRVTAAASCPYRFDVNAAYSLLEQARAGLLATLA
jgi:hypothetical protein